MEITRRMSNTNFFRAFVLIVVPIIFWRFYWYVGFNHNRTALYSFLLAAVLVLFFFVISVNGKLRRINKSSYYSKYILFFIPIIFVSILNAGLYWGQSVVLTFRAGCFAFIVLYFYLLYTYKLSYEKGLHLILFFSVIYFVLWLYAVSQAPDVVFGNLEEVRDDRGFARIIQLNSIDLVYLVYFISLVKVSTKKEKLKLLWWMLLIVSSILIFYSLSRVVILASLLISVVFLLREKPVYLLLAVVAVLFSYEYIMSNPVVSSLIGLTQEEVGSGSESALRIVEYTQFPQHYPFRIGTFLFGNGSPHVASSYGVYEESLKSVYRFNRSDAGYVGLFVTYGLSSIILFIMLLVRVVKQKVSMRAMPFKLFVIFLFIINISSWEFFTCGIGFMFSLYFLDQDRYYMIEENPSTQIV